jgi:CRP-like cAMP-binding protein
MSAYASIVNQKPSRTSLVAHASTTGYTMSYDDLQHLYASSHAGSEIGRYSAEGMMTEYQDRILSIMGDSPETRYRNLLEKEPELLLHIPQKHIASYLGITPETLSRIRRRIRLEPKY